MLNSFMCKLARFFLRTKLPIPLVVLSLAVAILLRQPDDVQRKVDLRAIAFRAWQDARLKGPPFQTLFDCCAVDLAFSEKPSHVLLPYRFFHTLLGKIHVIAQVDPVPNVYGEFPDKE
ncbi:MAG TPA: hypothetical protein VGZ93_12600 [Candidatus Methylacidiphilales bacterium]|nr:hypothetical protein [Candidatus Methylacidiphilales bacterium]